MRSTVGVEEASWSADLLAGRTIGPRSTFGRDPGARSRSRSHLPGCHALHEPKRRYPSTLRQLPEGNCNISIPKLALP